MHSELARRAQHELRQALSFVRGALELAGHGESGDHGSLEPSRIEDLIRTLDRACAVVAESLDPDLAATWMIPVTPRTVDLQETVERALGRVGAPGAPGEGTSLELEPALVEVDPILFEEVVASLVSRLQAEAPGARLTVRVRAIGDAGAEIELGADPWSAPRHELMSELERPLDLRDPRIDLSYIRAVVQRHNGSVSLAPHGEAGLAVRLRLPPPTDRSQDREGGTDHAQS